MLRELYIGIMSGTSLDGVDVVIMDFTESQPVLIASQCTPMPEMLRESLSALCLRGETTLQALGELDHQLGQLYAQCTHQLLNRAAISADEIIAIGCHGQTIWHSPQGAYPFTLQIGDGNLIAALTGITTVADFRRKDMAYGGQGAPLVPAFHQVLFSHPDQLTVILNVGGISNISVLQAGQPARGYDTGPGNVLMDAWITHCKGLPYDAEGRWASEGRVHQPLLNDMLMTPFFKQPAPRSTGRELFSLSWLQHHLARYPSIAPADVQATLAELTVISVCDELRKLSPSEPQKVLLVCGGGARNPLLMAGLTARLPDWSVGTTTTSGLDIDYVEAAAFAWLAYQRMHHLPGNVPEVTGASQAVSLGAIYPAE